MAGVLPGSPPVPAREDRTVVHFKPTPTRRTGSGQIALRGPSRLWFIAAILICVTGAPVRGDDRVLTTAEQIRKLTREEAERGFQVRIRGVVTYSDPTSLVFVQDATGGVRVRVPKKGPVPLRGQDVEVEGVTAHEYWPAIVPSKITVLGDGRLPELKRTTVAELVAGAEDAVWVEVEGVVRDWDREKDAFALALHSRGHRVRFVLTDPTLPEEKIQHLVDAKIRVRGVCDVVRGGDRPMIKVRALEFDRDVTVEQAAPVDPFDVAVTPLSQLPESAEHRVMVRAEVVMPQTGNIMFVREGNHRLTVQTRQRSGTRPGDLVEIVGFPERDGLLFSLTQSRFRAIAPAGTPRDSGTDYLPLLQTTRDVRALSPEKAKRGYPVRITGVVTYYDAPWNNLLVQDATNGIFVLTSQQRSIEVGQLVEITGFSTPGNFAPMVNETRTKVLGHTDMPRPLEVPFEHLLTGREDSQWISLEGIIRAITHTGPGEEPHMFLEVAHGRHRFSAWIPGTANSETVRKLTGARVRITGPCGTEFNDRRQIVGIRIYTSSLASVKVLDVPAEDAFAIDTVPIDRVLQFDPEAQPGRRTKVSGQVTWCQPGKVLYLQDDTGGLCVELEGNGYFPTGTTVEVVGFPNVEHYSFSLQRAIVRTATVEATPVAPVELSGPQLLEAVRDASLVRLEARLTDVTRRKDGSALVLQAGHHVFEAFLDRPTADESFAGLQQGSRVAVTGVCTVQRDGKGTPLSFRLLLRDPSDVMVLERPPWWTSRHFFLLLAGAGIATVGALAWVASLRRRVRRQTGQILERLEREMALEARYQQLVENATDIIFTTDLDGRLTSLNAAGETATGFSRAEILGRSLAPPGVSDPHADFPSVAIGEARSVTRDLAWRTKDNRVVLLEVNTRPILDGERPVGFQGIARDITLRRRFESDLLRAKEAADAANRAKSEFLTTMSHEIRTPMNGVLGMAELLSYTPLNADQRNYLKMAQSSAEGLMSIINDILDFSKIEAGKLDLDLSPFDLRESLSKTLEPLNVRAVQKGLKFALQIPPDVPQHLVGDRLRLGQVLLNLVGNAIKFTERGEVAVDVAVEPGALPSSIDLQFRVRDTGIGVPREKQQLIFEAFTQADSSTTRRFGGTGLGLAISAKLVQLMCGRIWLESEPNLGSTFCFTARFELVAPLQPVDRPLPADDTTGSVRNSSRVQSKLRILLADDDPVNREYTIHLLRANGHTVTTACNGHEALSLLASETFDVVLMDVEMPEMDGAEATRLLREREKDSGTHVPVVALTAHALKEDFDRCMTEGMDAHLTKPLLARHLHETLDRLTSRCEQSSGRDVVAPANGDQTGYRTNAEPFSEQSGEHLSSIDTALDRNDAPELVTANTLSGFLVGLLEASTTGQAFTPEEASGEADWAPAWEAFEAPATESPEPDARTPALHKDSNPSSVAAPWAPRGCE